MSDEKKPKPAFSREEVRQLEEFTKKLILKFSVVPCKGERALVAECSEAYEKTCHLRDDPGCVKDLMRREGAYRKKAEGPREKLEKAGVRGPMAEKLGKREYRHSKAMDEVTGWFVKNPRPRILLLLGNTGIGKTFAAAHLFTLMPNGQMISGQELYLQRRNDSAYKALLDASFLVIDDLGAEPSEFDDWRKTVAALICQRSDLGLATCITSNLSLPAFRERYGDRVHDRVTKEGTIALLSGTSIR